MTEPEVPSTFPPEEEVFENHWISRLRRGCLYLLMAGLVVSFAAFLVLMVWEQFAE